MIEQFPQSNKGGRKGFDAEVERVQTIELRNVARQLETTDPEIVNYIKEIIGKIDFSILRELYLTHARRSGVSERDVNFIDPNNIFIVPTGKWIDNNTFMRQLNQANVIVVNADSVRQMKGDENMKELIPIAIFESIVHEYVHATGAQELTRDFSSIQSGYAAHVQVGDTMHDFSHLFNEGVTMMIEHDVATEYLKRSPIQYQDGRILNTKEFDAYRECTMRTGGYEEARAFVYRLSEYMAEKAGVPADVIRNGMINGYYDGSGFFAKEGRDVLEELVGPTFSFALQNAKTADDIHSLIQEFNLPHIDDKTLSKIKRFVAKTE